MQCRMPNQRVLCLDRNLHQSEYDSRWSYQQHDFSQSSGMEFNWARWCRNRLHGRVGGSDYHHWLQHCNCSVFGDIGIGGLGCVCFGRKPVSDLLAIYKSSPWSYGRAISFHIVNLPGFHSKESSYALLQRKSRISGIVTSVKDG